MTSRPCCDVRPVAVLSVVAGVRTNCCTGSSVSLVTPVSPTCFTSSLSQYLAPESVSERFAVPKHLRFLRKTTRDDADSRCLVPHGISNCSKWPDSADSRRCHSISSHAAAHSPTHPRTDAAATGSDPCATNPSSADSVAPDDGITRHAFFPGRQQRKPHCRNFRCNR